MMQILGLSITGALFGILAGLFGTVARVYDILLKLSGYFSDGGVPDNLIITTSNVMTTMYTLAGVFMLFRVTLSMINLLIDPDKVHDSQVGPSKMVVRIITSIAMLLIFVPNGWVFSKNPDNPGILMRIEKALLAQDGLVHNMIPEVNGEKTNFKSSNKDGLFIDNVYAAGYDCYYVKVNNLTHQQLQKLTEGGKDADQITTTIFGVMHLTFYSDETGKNKLCKPNIVGGTLLADCPYSYDSDSNSPYTSYTKKLAWDKLSDGWPSTYNCPNLIDGNQARDVGANDWYGEGNNGWYGGWHSEDTMKAAISARNSSINVVGNDDELKNEIRDTLGVTGHWLLGVSDEAVLFAQNALSAFIECNGDDANCEALKAGMLLSYEGNKAVATELNKENSSMQLDFIIGVVAGIGLVVWIAVLCVEVVIRRFKLILLEIIAPIPIIAYIDPKDETFSKWGKMYISTFLDLFLKLIAISFAIALLKQIGAMASSLSGLLVFFYIVAILLFGKMIPTMISKIFGLDLSSGTFKDIIGMSKKVLGAGTGAVVGAGAGLVTGVTAFRATKGQGVANRMLEGIRGTGSVVQGIGKGAKNGSQGHILQGAMEIGAVNAGRRAAYNQGLTTTNLLTAATLGKVGLDPASAADRQVAVIQDKKKVADGVPSVLDVPFAAYKKSGYAMTLDSLLQQGKITGAEHKDFTKDYLDWQSVLLPGAYGDKTGKNLNKEKLDTDYANRIIDKDRYDKILSLDRKFQNPTADTKLKDLGLDSTVKVEIGIQNTLATAIDTVNASAKGSGYYADAIKYDKTKPIKDFAGLDTAVNNAYGTSKDLSAEINEKTIANSAYITAKASKEVLDSNKK